MVPQEYFAMYVGANAIAFGILALAFFRPAAVRWVCVALFAWASVTNTVTALTNPRAYLGYAALTLSNGYRAFINGWFADHVASMVLPIAAGQLVIAVLLIGGKPLRRLGELGAVLFLLAIVPLGVGAGLPFSFTVIGALLFMERALTHADAAANAPPAPTRQSHLREAA